MKSDQPKRRLKTAIWWVLHCQNFYVRLLESPHPCISHLRDRDIDAGVVYHLRNGLRIKLASGHYEHCLIEEIWMDEEYTNPTGFKIARTDTVVDIGAHKGVFSLYASYLAKEGRVFSYEPHPSNFSYLQENLTRNNAANTRAFNFAVWSELGKTTLKTSSSSLSHSLVLQTDGVDSVEVPCTGLREIFEDNRISRCEFLKIDAEGAEYEILRATPLQTLARTDRIVVEVHTVPGWSPARLCNFLTERGFKTSLHGQLVFARRS